MKLTTKGRYAVMAMADLASYSNNNPVSLSEISTRQNISTHGDHRLVGLRIYEKIICLGSTKRTPLIVV